MAEITKCPLCGAEIEKTTVLKETNRIYIDCKDKFKPKRWIPCSERLPEIYQRVLTVDIDRKVTENFRCNIKTGELKWSRGFGITHWMPLPEPPEEVQDDDEH